MKRIHIFSLIYLVTLLIGCNNKFLEVAPEVALDEDKVFADPVLAAQFADNAYRYRPDDYLRWTSITGTSQATDEAVGTDITSNLLYTFYNHGGEDHISGAIAEADCLGIFGRDDVFAANVWPLQSVQTFLFGAFSIFRNYDGAGAAFGDTSVEAPASDIANGFGLCEL